MHRWLRKGRHECRMRFVPLPRVRPLPTAATRAPVASITTASARQVTPACTTATANAADHAGDRL